MKQEHEIHEFDACSAPLTWINIVEAGAGTGKTYSIQTVAARLLLEKGLVCRRIAVVTFTEAATAELSDRVRSIIRSVDHYLNKIRDGEEERCRELVEMILRRGVSMEVLQERVRTALEDFDELRISTIHAFCFRMLTEHALSGRIRFELKLQKDCSRLLLEIFSDFQRRFLCSGKCTPAAAEMWAKLGFSPKKLCETLLPVVPGGRAIPSWELAAREPDGEPGSPDEEKFRIAVLRNAREFALAEFSRRAEEEGILSFDTVLSMLAERMDAIPELTEAIAEDFDALLVDEFQDTDPMQLRVFSGIAQSVCWRSDPQGRVIFMIGDPKQAIYSFRGGDVECYLRGRSIAPEERRYTLRVNYRSGKRFVKALNDFYSAQNLPFGDPEIAYTPVGWHRETDDVFYRGKPLGEPISFMPYTPEKDGIARVCDEILTMLTDPGYEIILKGAPRRRVKPGDFAVLVRTREELARTVETLRASGIPQVSLGSENVLDGREAVDLADFMENILNPADVKLAARSLSGSLFQCTASGIDAVRNGAGEFTIGEFTHDLAEIRELWRQCGFQTAFRRAVAMMKIDRRVFSIGDGGRSWRVFCHLLTLISALESAEGLPPEELFFRFLRELRPESRTIDEDAAELPVDAPPDAVRVITIHKSKGLEFPIVLVPSVKMTFSKRFRTRICHVDGERVYDVGGDPQLEKRCREEDLKESLRLAYVAITRAAVRFRGVLPKPEKQEGFPGYVTRLCGISDPSPGELIDAWDNGVCAGNPEILIPEPALTPPEGASLPPPEPMEHLMARPLPKILPAAGWSGTSFTAMAPSSHEHGSLWTDEEREDDEGTSPGESTETEEEGVPPLDGGADDIFRFPAGSRTGTAWHRIMERISFAGASDLEKTVSDTLGESFLLTGDPAGNRLRVRCVTEMIASLLRLRLPGAYGGFSLGEIPDSDRVSEMDFAVPERVRTGFDGLCRRLAAYGLESSSPKFTGAVAMNGTVDLLFRRNGRYYLADWKSNRLGADRRSFTPENISRAMRENFYILQALIYLNALRKFFRWDETSYQREFGGIYYGFMRGAVLGDPERCFWHLLPEWKVFEELKRGLTDE